MLLKNIIKNFKLIIKLFIVYTIIMFFYTSLVHTPLGKGFEWTCFEPGCVIIKDSRIVIYGDVEELNFNYRFVFGKVNKPNSWMIENENGYNIEGYFILDKNGNEIQTKLTQSEFVQKSKKLGINSQYVIKYKSPFWLVYNPYYWYVIIMNMFD